MNADWLLKIYLGKIISKKKYLLIVLYTVRYIFAYIIWAGAVNL